MVRNLPYSLEAEMGLLGCAISFPAAAHGLAIDPEDFFNPKHQLVARALASLVKAGHRIDETALAVQLGDQALEKIGGLSFLTALSLKALTAEVAPQLLDVVRAHARKRRLLLGLSEVLDGGFAPSTSTEELVAQTQQLLREASDQQAGFQPAKSRLEGEEEERQRLVARELQFQVTFLDDFFRGILPHDLVMLGAETGVGKTELAKHIAMVNAQKGRHVYYFALEAEPREIERRILYGLLSYWLYRTEAPGRERLNYPDWFRGRCSDLIPKQVTEQANAWVNEHLATLFTRYRGRDFAIDELERSFLQVAPHADLVVIDHLHYVDTDDDLNENRAFKQIVKRIRDCCLETGVPVIVVAHLRKPMHRRVSPTIHDFHGSSDITKIATQCILLSRAPDGDQPWIANTYIQAPKYRQGGACPYVALVGFDLRLQRYEKPYVLGRMVPDKAGERFEVIDEGRLPRWARRKDAA